MLVECVPTVRLDGRFLHVHLVPDPDLGREAHWILSVEAAKQLVDALNPFLEDWDP